MIKPQKLSPFVQYEKVKDFAKESFIISIKGYYMKPTEIISNRNIPLYVSMIEEVTHIYYLTVSASDWIRENIECNINDRTVTLTEEFMYKFDLVRVIPENGHKLFDSFLRVMLKQVPEKAKLYSVEEEMYGESWNSKQIKAAHNSGLAQ
ncbi:hypothetical protein WJN01_07830 [Flavobacteriaceae bacterium SZ-1-7]|uniref:hypothetical protein n=1 Tax=Tamlana sedimenti TaxID=3134126 RepID=UPI0031234648